MAADTIMHRFRPNLSAVHPEKRPPIAVPAVYVEAIAPELSEDLFCQIKFETVPISTEFPSSFLNMYILKLRWAIVVVKMPMGWLAF